MRVYNLYAGNNTTAEATQWDFLQLVEIVVNTHNMRGFQSESLSIG